MTDLSSTLEDAFQRIAIDDEGRACRDIPDSACREEPRNFFTHAASLALSKSADGLIDPKLVLSWLMSTLGAPAYLIGLLVPVREAGALLPQLFTAGAIRRLPKRKFVWAAGSFVQGVSAVAIAVSALTLDGAAAGWAIVGWLAVLALARSACSVAYKDVLGKTVGKSRRGAATGLAGSLAAGTAIVFALVLTAGWIDRFALVIGALAAAGACWIAAAALFATLAEEAGAVEGGASAISAALENVALLKEDGQLRLFIAVRGLLTATALAPPFLVAAGGGTGEEAYGGLGLLVLASAGAALSSSYVWGRLADRSSRRVLVVSAVLGCTALLAAGGLGLGGFLGAPAVLPALLFLLMIAYQGVRLGRSTHLVDMAGEETRAAYTALSNTVIGLVLLLGGVFGAVAAAAGPEAVMLIMGVMCALAALAGRNLNEVQRD